MPWEIEQGWGQKERLGEGDGVEEEIIDDMDPEGLGGGIAKEKKKPCLGSKTLFREPDYDDVDLIEVLQLEQLSTYIEKSSAGIFAEVLMEACEKWLKGRDVPRPEIPQIYCIPKMASKIWGLSTLPIDSSTYDGVAVLLEEFIRAIGTKGVAMEDRTTLLGGDLMTTDRIDGVKNLRKRDVPQEQMKWSQPINGMLHMGMTSAAAILESNGGRPDGRDPGSLRRIAALLGRNRVFDSKNVKDYSAMHRLLVQTHKAHLVVAAIAVASRSFPLVNVYDPESLAKWLAEDVSMLTELVERMVKDLMGPMQVNKMWEEARKLGEEQYKKMRTRLKEKLEKIPRGGRARNGLGREEVAGVAGEGNERGNKKKKSAVSLNVNDYKTLSALTKSKDGIIERVTQDVRDVGYENFILMLQHTTMYVDFYSAVRKGDSGRVERSLDMHTIFFHGTRRWNYARELLDLQIERRVEWSDDMRGVWLRNILLNLSGGEGKFMGIDEVNEYVVRELKDGLNPRGTIQSRVYLQETVSRNVMSYRAVKRTMTRTIGIPYGGSNHSKVDDRRDILTIIDLLLQEGVGQYKKGRRTTGNAANPLEIKESIDAFAVGMEELGSGVPLATAIFKRTKGRRGLGDNQNMDGVDEVFIIDTAMGVDRGGDS